MKPEYFPPKEDVILQNEAPTDMYIIVSGAVVSTELLFRCQLSEPDNSHLNNFKKSACLHYRISSCKGMGWNR